MYSRSTEGLLMSNSLKIGELAKRTGCQVETIRYYERRECYPSLRVRGRLPTLFGPRLERSLSGTDVRWI